ncbi:uncharacterized protein LOC105748742 [Orcinus orca]|uniref:uncharacterized protein LOC105748742 n=1 Tax=Orcinus orca TaxID=9733 RepID=UPI00211220B2|nr:uncharacterized protein LOC105748742 [Orcinus orca]
MDNSRTQHRPSKASTNSTLNPQNHPMRTALTNILPFRLVLPVTTVSSALTYRYVKHPARKTLTGSRSRAWTSSLTKVFRPRAQHTCTAGAQTTPGFPPSHICTCCSFHPEGPSSHFPSVNSYSPFLDRKSHPLSQSHQSLCSVASTTPRVTSVTTPATVTVRLCLCFPRAGPGLLPPSLCALSRPHLTERGRSGGCSTEAWLPALLTARHSRARSHGQGESLTTLVS